MQRWHRRLALCVLTGYLLATHLAWVAHDHSSHQHGDCCSISIAASSSRGACHGHDSHAHHEHGGHHQATPCDGHSHQHERPCAPRSDAPLPLHDPHCGACQFLALAQLTAPVAEFLPHTGEVQVLTALVSPLVVSRIATSHPARGPPVEA
ncbi:MAG: hypothetical protein HZA46_02585 [Planctomycetales bacterium]|nr:hypothetical protein [Planctomycetales bacterium]